MTRLGVTASSQSNDSTVISDLGGTPWSEGDGFDIPRNSIYRKELQWGRDVDLIRRFFRLAGTEVLNAFDEWEAEDHFDGGRTHHAKSLIATFAQGDDDGFTAYHELAYTDLWDSDVDARAAEIADFIDDHSLTELFLGYQQEAATDQGLRVELTATADVDDETITIKTSRPGSDVGLIKKLTAGRILNFGSGRTATLIEDAIPEDGFPSPTTLNVLPIPVTIPSGTTALIETTSEIKQSFRDAHIKLRDRFLDVLTAEQAAVVRWIWTRIDNDFQNASAIEWYPGDDFVDVVCIDIYPNYGHSANNPIWEDFADSYDFAREFADVHGKTVAVAELGMREGLAFRTTGGPDGPSGSPVTIDLQSGILSAESAGARVTFLETESPSDVIDSVLLDAPIIQGATSMQVDELNEAIPNGTFGYISPADPTQTKALFFQRMLETLQGSPQPECEFVSYFAFDEEIDEAPYGSLAALAAWAEVVNEPPFVGEVEGADQPSPMILRCLAEDETTVLLSLTELNEGAQYGFGIPPEGFNLGGGDFDDEYIDDYAYDGAVQVASHHTRTAMTFSLVLFAADAEDMRTRMRLLNELLDKPRIWQYRPQGSDESLFIDTFRSPKARLLSGDRDQLFIVQNHFVGRPVVEIRRQPKMRLRRVEHLFVALLTNSPESNFVQFTNPGNVRSPLRISVEPHDPDTQLVQVTAGLQSFGNLTELQDTFTGFSIDEAEYPPGSTTTGHGTHAEPLAANGFVAITGFEDANTHLARWQMPFEPTDQSAIDGARRWRYTGWADPGAIYHVQLRWGLTQPLSNIGPLIAVDLSTMDPDGDPVSFSLDVGLSAYERLARRLVIEGWASCDDDTKTIQWDVAIPIPASEAIFMAYEPTYQGVANGATEFDPLALVVSEHIDLPSTDAKDDAPAESRDDLGELDIANDGRPRIGAAATVGTGENEDKTDEAISTGPQQFAPGTYEVTWPATVHNADKKRGLHAELRVRNLNDVDPETADVAITPLYSVKGVTDYSSEWKARFTVTDPSEHWDIQLVYVHDRVPLTGNATHKVYTDGPIRLSVVRFMSKHERAVLDGFTERAHGDINLGKTHDLGPVNIPEAEAGTQVLVFHFDEAPVAPPGSDARGPLPSFSALREYRVVGDIDPMVMAE